MIQLTIAMHKNMYAAKIALTVPLGLKLHKDY
jgi:hypothetical protein